MEGFGINHAKFDILAFVQKKFREAVKKSITEGKNQTERDLINEAYKMPKLNTIEQENYEYALHITLWLIEQFGENRSLGNVADNISAKLKEMNK